MDMFDNDDTTPRTAAGETLEEFQAFAAQFSGEAVGLALMGKWAEKAGATPEQWMSAVMMVGIDTKIVQDAVEIILHTLKDE